MDGLTMVLLGTLTVTSYQPIPSQTDSSPNWTSIGQHVHGMGVAVSQDLLASGQACYGDVLSIPGYGLKVINDTMNRRHTNHVDILVFTKAEESAVGVRKLPVTVIRSERRFCTNGRNKRKGS